MQAKTAEAINEDNNTTDTFTLLLKIKIQCYHRK